jgi:hypothetical protein
MIAALFVETNGVYFGLHGVDLWDIHRNAMTYDGPYPVVAHPPCHLWGAMAAVNFARYGGEHNRPGNDGGKFESALAAVHSFGGVLEHPAKSKAFEKYGIDRPIHRGWQPSGHGWVCEVWQSAYGHKADKKTWLYYYSPINKNPFELDWSTPRGTHQIGWHGCTPKNKSRPTLSKKEANATPSIFRDTLLALAEHTISEKRK